MNFIDNLRIGAYVGFNRTLESGMAHGGQWYQFHRRYLFYYLTSIQHVVVEPKKPRQRLFQISEISVILYDGLYRWEGSWSTELLYQRKALRKKVMEGQDQWLDNKEGVYLWSSSS